MGDARRAARGRHGPLRRDRRPRPDRRPRARRRCCSRSSPPATLMGLNAVDVRDLGRADRDRRRRAAAASRRARRERSLFADARAGVRELAARPEIRVLLGSSTGIVLCVGITNIGEVVLAREVLGVGGTGLAMMVTAGGLGTVARLALRPLHHGRRLGLAPRLRARRVVHGGRTDRLRPPARLLARRPRAGAGRLRQRPGARARPPAARLQHPGDRCTAACSRCRRPAPRSPSRSPSSLSGALIAGAGVETAFLVCGVGLALVLASALPRLRAAWPTPPSGRPPRSATR